ncbi:CPBP family intramembrane glutamic endopeptidase [uncultured Schumannella sp.]|uniref:CPBP family intramembrane glutamic endopeptidase n=1 Tax=uncultured Schumannella sp. TaxID=1195956 RepID=UPI0025FAEC3F|nr:CPBP family intramembrane glutamic endopeptidase [uncultured Schumannella sp.]
MRHPLRSIAVFVLLALGGAWLVALPLWFTGGLENPWFSVFAVAMMTTPALAALLVVRVVDREPDWRTALGLRPPGPGRRFVGFLVLGLALSIVMIVAALLTSAAFGLYRADLVEFSGFRAYLEPLIADASPLPMPFELLVLVQAVSIVPAALINTIPTLGEELGWRGWLLPRLMPLGAAPAVLISGVIWGLWHAPLILLGYNYPTAPGWLGVLAMCGMCIVVGGVFGWLRVRSGSVWPAALAHGAFNAAAGLSLLVGAAGDVVDTIQATILGWSGWILPAILVAVLIATGQFRRAPGTVAPGTVAPGTVAPVTHATSSTVAPGGVTPSEPDPTPPSN